MGNMRPPEKIFTGPNFFVACVKISRILHLSDNTTHNTTREQAMENKRRIRCFDAQGREYRIKAETLPKAYDAAKKVIQQDKKAKEAKR